MTLVLHTLDALQPSRKGGRRITPDGFLKAEPDLVARFRRIWRSRADATVIAAAAIYILVKAGPCSPLPIEYASGAWRTAPTQESYRCSTHVADLLHGRVLI